MASLRDVRLKIRSVKNISQITQAMKLVAAAKLRRVQERVEQGKPYSHTMADLVGMLAPNVREFKHPLLDERPVGAAGLVVISADKGLAGSYNSNILRIAHQFLDRKIADLQGNAHTAGRSSVQVVTIGRKATDYFTKRGYNVVQKFPSLGDSSSYDQVRAIANAVTGMFLTEQVDEVHIAFTEFVNTITQRPQVIKFLPIEPPQGMNEGESTPAATSSKLDFIFEPPAPELLGVLLPRFVETRVYQILLEAVAAEFGARMTAMTNATKNADEQIETLTLLANRTRQAMITKELLDIVGGAEALKG
jgi:F-type H+-transporting ATPase subunit gamma